ncbi:hypothetical protein KOI35_22260 [Actinoplanes bogorensis]|uniref:Uncharacterized protein n=1 Tax=Paractinoplanes bogorensis TaxID=1610840 RepID=A0ABS5YU81_9ACTN|nr:hypothetical protein [Actinoplanes bogorensis]MBU2666229.1 hypothetical protein [Actinoplanes bogorensis]
MDLDAAVNGVDWSSFASPPWHSPAAVRTALAGITSGREEWNVAWAVAMLEDAVAHGHSGSLSPAAGPAVDVLLAVAVRWRAEARAQALSSLSSLLSYEAVPPWAVYERDGIRVDVEDDVRARIRAGLPLLESLAAEAQPWRSNRGLARQLIDEAG